MVGRGDPSVTRSEWHPLRYWCNLDGAAQVCCGDLQTTYNLWDKFNWMSIYVIEVLLEKPDFVLQESSGYQQWQRLWTYWPSTGKGRLSPFSTCPSIHTLCPVRSEPFLPDHLLNLDPGSDEGWRWKNTCLFLLNKVIKVFGLFSYRSARNTSHQRDSFALDFSTFPCHLYIY